MSNGTKIQFVVLCDIRYGECYRCCYDTLPEAETGLARWRQERRNGTFSLYGEWWTPPVSA